MSIASAERVSSEMFCSSVFYPEMMFFEDSWGENRHRGVLEKAEKYFLKLTSLVFVLAGERERERERDECATERERERKEKRDVII